MKKGQDVKQMLQRINDDVKYKKDYIVPLSSLATEISKGSYPELIIQGEDVTRENKELSFTDHSLSLLCGKLDIGSRYIKKCLPISQQLVVQNLNFWIDHTKERNYMVRAYEKGDTKIARAILTDRYKRIDNDVIATKAINRMLDVGCEIKHADYDGDNLSITGVFPEIEGNVGTPQVDDIIQAGITITNNEVGGGSFKVLPFLYRLVCTNGMVAPSYVGTFLAKHVGKKVLHADDDTQGEESLEKMLDKITALKDPKIFEDLFGVFKASKFKKTSSDQIVKLAKQHSLTDDERAGIFTRLDKVYGDTFTVDNFSLANAVTNLANDDEMSESRARFFQELGGHIIFNASTLHALR